MARKTDKDGKYRNVHFRTWNMATKLKIMVYWLVLCQLDTAGDIIEKGASVEEMPP
jgi:hypothetical protein